jgi:hypothetical protein
MNLFEVLALALDPGFILRARGIEPDPWQQRLLLSEDRQVLLNCSRQSGKSTTVAVLALHTALCRAKSLVLLLSPSLRQSVELFRKVLDCFNAVRRIMPVTSLNQTRVEFRNGSRIVCLPGKEETIRSFSGVNLLVIDEAARVPDDLYRSVRPMLAVSRGRLICLSTPFGKRGFFYEEWERCGGLQSADLRLQIEKRNQDQSAIGPGDWLRIRIPWQNCPRIEADFIDLEKRSMGESWIRQEYECSFEALEGLVFPDFEEQSNPTGAGNSAYARRAAAGAANVGGKPTQVAGGLDQEPNSKNENPDLEFGSWNLEIPQGRRVGGIDFGFRNPFCALWGVLDRDDVLWITDERYVRESPIHEHAAALREAASGGEIVWYADPAGRTEIEELRHAGLKVIRGSNAIQAGIAAINARLRTGRLKVLRPPRGDSKNQEPNSKNQLGQRDLEFGSLEFGSSEYSGCPNLLAEAKLYRYPSTPESGRGSAGSEVPIDQHNHALAALRYLVSRLDAGFMAKFRRPTLPSPNLGGGKGGGVAGNLDGLEIGPTGRRQIRLNEAECWKTVISN